MAYFRCGGGGHSDAEYNNLMDQLVEETTTGPIASFTDGANNIPTKQVICHINPTETGTGEKSPQNPYVIGGFTEANITQTDGQTPPIISKLYTVSFGQTVYGGTLNVTTGVLTINKVAFKFKDISVIVISQSLGWFRFNNSIMNATRNDITCECYTKVMSYNASQTTDLSIYKADSASVFVHDSRYSSWSDLIADMGDYKFVVGLENPTIIQLTPTEVKTLLGANNFYHDCNGDIDVTYRANGALYVQEHPITRDLMAARPTEQIQEQEEQQEEKEINKSEDN